MNIRKLAELINHKGTLCSLELVEIDGLIAEIILRDTSRGGDNIYASPLLVASYPEMLVIKDYSKNQGIADALADAGIVKVFLISGDVRFCSLLA